MKLFSNKTAIENCETWTIVLYALPEIMHIFIICYYKKTIALIILIFKMLCNSFKLYTKLLNSSTFLLS